MRKQRLNTILLFLLLTTTWVSAAVDGYVYDINTKAPLGDVAITIVGTEYVVFTDSTGLFHFEDMSPKSKLILKLPGYANQNVFVPAESTFKVYMSQLEKQFVNHSLEKVNPKMADYTTAETNDDMLWNTGAYNVKRSGLPGEGSDTYIRGVNSLNTFSNPVYVVDGMLLGKYEFGMSAIGGYAYSTIAGLNPEDIESMEVLKDAASLSKYGFRGANGVIIINTVKAKEGKTAITYRNSIGVMQNPREIPMMNAEQHAGTMLKQLFSAGFNINHINKYFPYLGNDDEDYPEFGFDTDWQDVVFDEGLVNNHYFSYTGGDQVAKMHLSIGYTGKRPTVTPANYNRLTSKINTQIKISQKLSVDMNMNFNFMTNELVDQSYAYQANPLLAGLLKSPMTTTHKVANNGSLIAKLADQDSLNFSNPAAIQETAYNRQKRYTMMGNYKFRYQANEAFGINAIFGLELDQNDEKAYFPNAGIAPLYLGEAEQTMRQKTDKYLSFQGTLSADYAKSFGGGHSLNADAGAFIRRDQQMLDFGMAFNTGNDALTYIQNGDSRTRSKDGLWEYMTQVGFFVNANYDYLNKYFVDLGVSLDGSSRIGQEAEGGMGTSYSPMGVFPSAKFSWEIANEEFLREVNLINSLKPHVSYGLVGSDLFGNYLSKDYYIPSQYYNITGLQSGGIVNQGVKWESASILNVGVQTVLMSNRLGLSADYYVRDNKDLLVNTNIPEFYGSQSLLMNSGEIQTKGIELSLFATVLDGGFKWQTGLNFTKERSEIMALPNDEYIDFEGGQKINTVGEQPGAFYGYEMVEVFQTEQAALDAGLVDQFGATFDAGDIHFKDIDGNHIIDDNDRTIIGNPHPDFYGNFSNHFSYKRFSLDVNVQFVYGNELYNHVRYMTENSTTLGNKSIAFLTAWTGENSNSNFPAVDMRDGIGNDRFSSRWIEDGSYLRVKDITLSYDLNTTNISWLNSATVFVSGHNLITVTDYLGYDPEFSYGFGYQHSGIDYGKVPQPKAILGGIRIDL